MPKMLIIYNNNKLNSYLQGGADSPGVAESPLMSPGKNLVSGFVFCVRVRFLSLGKIFVSG